MENKGNVGKFIVTIYADQKWQKTNVHVTPLETVKVNSLGGTWTFNPQVGSCGADGLRLRGYAKPGYTCPGANEGQLIGRIGAQIFPLGAHAQTPTGLEGELELCINDDLEGRYGAGMRDNSGFIQFELTFQQRV